MRVRSFQNGLRVAALLLIVAQAASARQATLTLESGRQITGELISETEDTLTLRVGDSQVTIQRSRIADQQTRFTLAEQYRKQRAQLADDDYEGRYELAYRLYKRGTAAEGEQPEALPLAKRELDSILQDQPSNEKARLLRTVVVAKLRGGRQPSSPPMNPAGGEKRGGTPRSGGPDDAEGRGNAAQAPPLLSEKQIRMIKAFEINLDTQPPPRVVVPRDVVGELFQRYREDPIFSRYVGQRGVAEFRNLPGDRQLAVLFDLQAREFYPRILFRDEPATLQEFRVRIHRNYVLRYCGRCHSQQGGAPGLRLITRGANSERVAYTNFLTLRRTSLNGNPVLNTAQPGESLLLQYGLPRPQAQTPHPAVRGWRPLFQGTDDPRFRRIADWIGGLWNDQYPIDFQPAGGERESPPGAPAAGSPDADVPPPVPPPPPDARSNQATQAGPAMRPNPSNPTRTPENDRPPREGAERP